MQEARKIDFGKLFGFAAVSDDIAGSVDFRADFIEAKLGAKVGIEWIICDDLRALELEASRE